jgi:hypothetical protein
MLPAMIMAMTNDTTAPQDAPDEHAEPSERVPACSAAVAHGRPVRIDWWGRLRSSSVSFVMRQTFTPATSSAGTAKRDTVSA